MISSSVVLFRCVAVVLLESFRAVFEGRNDSHILPVMQLILFMNSKGKLLGTPLFLSLLSPLFFP